MDELISLIEKENEMENIKVSILCLCYNHENYIRKCLDGFVMQECDFEYEVLIHDDASTDNSASIIREYEQKYPNIIKPIYQTKNQLSQGIAVFYKHMYPVAKGEYIAYCEGDDFWTSKDKLQKQVDFLETHPDFSACVHRYDTVNKIGELTNVKTFGYYETEGIYTLKDFEKNELPSQLATLVCRNLFCKTGKEYPKEFFQARMQGDVKLFLYLLAHGDIYRMKEKFSCYRFVCEEGGGSWSSRMRNNYNFPYNQWKAIKKLKKIFNKIYDKKIKLKQRRKMAAFTAFKMPLRKFNSKTVFHALHVFIAERGMILMTLRALLKKVKNR